MGVEMRLDDLSFFDSLFLLFQTQGRKKGNSNDSLCVVNR